MKKLFLFIFLSFVTVFAAKAKTAPPVNADSIKAVHDSALAKTPMTANSIFPLLEYLTLVDSMVPNVKFGLSIRSVKTGEELGNIRGTEQFTPASTLKTLTTASALYHLPINYEPQTHLFLEGSITGKTFSGILRVRGEGDPNLSGRYYPDAMYMMNAMADSLKNIGIDTLNGIIELDTTFFEGPRRAEFWPKHFYNSWYGAEITALQFNDNCTLIRMKPGKEIGDTAEVYPVPDVGYVQIKNELTTGKGKAKKWTWALEDNEAIITIGGSIGVNLDSAQLVLPVRNPAFYFKGALLTAMNDRGVFFKENKKAVRGIEIKKFSFSAAPFLSVLDEINQRSQNLHAETLLRITGRHVTGKGSVEGGREAEKQYLNAIGIPAEDFEVYDGSGLSPRNKVKPTSETQLLRTVIKSARGDFYFRSLASPEIGTGSKRMGVLEYPWRTKFKTGFIGFVHALAGYIFDASGDTLAVAMYVNETGKTSDQICKDALDSIWVRIFNAVNAEYPHIMQAKELWLSGLRIQDFEERIRYFSEALKGTPYLLGPTGEGYHGDLDKKPMLRLDSVDCVTYVENALALAKAPSEDSLMQTLDKIRYLHATPSYANRKHYMIADWVLKDSIASILPVEGDTVIQRTLPKKKFFKAKGIKAEDETINLRYLPKEKAIDFASKTWEGENEIRGIGYVFNGDAVDIFHTGFILLNKGEKPTFRHASQIKGKVIDQPLEEYLRNSKKKIPGIVQFKFN